MNDQFDPEEVERLTRETLHHRAASIEPGADAYARLADKVATNPQRQVAWWQGPRMLWVGAASLTMAVAALAFVIATGGDDPEQVATPATTPTVEAEPTAPTADPDTDPTPTPAPILGGSTAVWPSGPPGPDWFATPEQAVIAFYEQFLLPAPAPDRDALRNEGNGRISVLNRGPDGGLTEDVIAEVVLAVSDSRWGVVSVSSPDVALSTPEDGASVSLDGLVLSGQATSSDPDDAVKVQLWAIDGSMPLFLTNVTGQPGAFEAPPLPIGVGGDASTGTVLVFATAFPFVGQTVPSVDMHVVQSVHEANPTPTPVGGGVDRNQGRPDGVVWPVDAVQPFGEWPTTPEDAAQQFVQQLGGWTLPVGEVTFLEPILMIADVELQFTGEDGQPFGTSTTVRVVGGFDEAGVANWGAVWALSERIEIDRSFFDGDEFIVSGAGQAFEGTIDTRLVDPTGNVAAEGFVTGGGVEMAPITGSVSLTENLPGPGFALLYDLGGLGITPSALTIIPVQLPELDSGPGIAESAACSASGLEPLAPDNDLPPNVESTRQAIGAAAIACDWAALEDLISDPSTFSYSFGLGGDPIGDWQSEEAAGSEPMRFLVETLRLPWAMDGDPGSAVYIWPDVFVLPWDDVVESQRDALRPIYTDDDFAVFSDIGGFVGYRLAITDTGEWIYFIAGD